MLSRNFLESKYSASLKLSTVIWFHTSTCNPYNAALPCRRRYSELHAYLVRAVRVLRAPVVLSQPGHPDLEDTQTGVDARLLDGWESTLGDVVDDAITLEVDGFPTPVPQSRACLKQRAEHNVTGPPYTMEEFAAAADVVSNGFALHDFQEEGFSSASYSRDVVTRGWGKFSWHGSPSWRAAMAIMTGIPLN